VEARQLLIENQKAEIVRINARFDAELARLKALGRRTARLALPRWPTARPPPSRRAERVGPRVDGEPARGAGASRP
jgi:hypothetical protein